MQGKTWRDFVKLLTTCSASYSNDYFISMNILERLSGSPWLFPPTTLPERTFPLGPGWKHVNLRITICWAPLRARVFMDVTKEGGNHVLHACGELKRTR